MRVIRIGGYDTNDLYSFSNVNWSEINSVECYSVLDLESRALWFTCRYISEIGDDNENHWVKSYFVWFRALFSSGPVDVDMSKSRHDRYYRANGEPREKELNVSVCDLTFCDVLIGV